MKLDDEGFRRLADLLRKLVRDAEVKDEWEQLAGLRIAAWQIAYEATAHLPYRQGVAERERFIAAVEGSAQAKDVA